MKIDWAHIDNLTKQYRETAGQVLNVEQFNLYAITHHSTKIEGSTLTQEETNTLLEKGMSIGGKPLEHQNMVLDHQEALVWLLEQAKMRKPVTIDFLKELSAKVMRRTGKQVRAILGDTDETKGDFRKVNVSAGGYYFVDQSKVISLVTDLTDKLSSSINAVKSTEEILTLSFVAHFDLVSIHPFTDGNGRVSRLLMNYIEAYHHQPLTIVHAEDRPKYIEALSQSRELKDTIPIVEFLAGQHEKGLSSSIRSFNASKEIKGRSKNDGYSLVF